MTTTGTIRPNRFGGPLGLDVDHITYNVEPVEVLDANLASCLPEHRDALLDARLELYPGSPS